MNKDVHALEFLSAAGLIMNLPPMGILEPASEMTGWCWHSKLGNTKNCIKPNGFSKSFEITAKICCGIY
jgi:hypothetical protein